MYIREYVAQVGPCWVGGGERLRGEGGGTDWGCCGPAWNSLESG